jgi:hypothetical protein
MSCLATNDSGIYPVTALVLLDADCIMTCPAILPTAQLGVLFEMQKQRGSHWTRCWRKQD